MDLISEPPPNVPPLSAETKLSLTFSRGVRALAPFRRIVQRGLAAAPTELALPEPHVREPRLGSVPSVSREWAARF